jgi:hypothetical protein
MGHIFHRNRGGISPLQTSNVLSYPIILSIVDRYHNHEYYNDDHFETEQRSYLFHVFLYERSICIFHTGRPKDVVYYRGGQSFLSPQIYGILFRDGVLNNDADIGNNENNTIYSYHRRDKFSQSFHIHLHTSKAPKGA